MVIGRGYAVLRLNGGAAFLRLESTLAQRMKEALAGTKTGMTEVEQKEKLERELDEQGEPFREFFVMPKRQLRTQREILRHTGRLVYEQKPKMDILVRNMIRRPRCEEMETDQDWPSVWPVAASFRSSVVPLAVRMGTRKHPERKPPFQTVGNLELVKIPNFLHLTPGAIERHCKAMKKFCTKWPAEFDDSVSMYDTNYPVMVSFSDYVHQGTSLRDPRSKVVTIRVKVSSLRLSDAAKSKLMRLVRDRYCSETDTLTIVTDRCYSRKQNWDYAMYLLTALYHECNKVEAWEGTAQRVDDLKIRFEGSTSKKVATDTAESVFSSTGPKAAAESDGDIKDSSIDRTIKRYGEVWEKYRNEKETPEMVNRYGDVVKDLLAIPPLSRSVESNSQ